MKTIKELLEPVTSRGIRLKVCVDTSEFHDFYKSQGSPDGEFNKKIWRPLMCERFMSDSYSSFSITENPDNLLDEWINKFLEHYPELGGSVNFIFTN